MRHARPSPPAEIEKNRNAGRHNATRLSSALLQPLHDKIAQADAADVVSTDKKKRPPRKKKSPS